MLSWAGSTGWGCELGVCVVYGVRDVGAGDAGGAELSVQECYLVSQLTVFVVEFANALVREGEALPQRGMSQHFRTDHQPAHSVVVSGVRTLSLN